MLKINAGINPSTIKFLTIEATKRIIRALITKVKRPKLKKFIGRVKRIRIGLIKILTNPSIKDTQRAAQGFAT